MAGGTKSICVKRPVLTSANAALSCGACICFALRGGGGIRTPGTLPFNSFQDCRHRPLGHTSGITDCKDKDKKLSRQKYLTALYSGGTYMDEAMRAAAPLVGPVYSNSPTKPEWTIQPGQIGPQFRAQRARGLGAAAAIVTGVSYSCGKIGYHGLNLKSGKTFSYQNQKIDVSYHGTGDLFSAVTAGALVSGKGPEDAFRIAADYTAETIRVTKEDSDDPRYGIHFESTIPYLLQLMEKDEEEFAKMN